MTLTEIKRSQRKVVVTGAEWYDNGIWRLEVFDPLGGLEFEYTIMDEDNDLTFNEFLDEALRAYRPQDFVKEDDNG